MTDVPYAVHEHAWTRCACGDCEFQFCTCGAIDAPPVEWTADDA